MYTPSKIERFNQNVLSKYHIYNSVFITLPFDAIDNTGVLLPLFTELCESGFKQQWRPDQIMERFSEKYLDTKDEQQLINLMFRFIQYVERQIVLFDAIEDAAFPVVNNMEGRGSLRDMIDKTAAKDKQAALRDFLQHFVIRTVLTAHPTQFYPGSVLGIIDDLTAAVRTNDLLQIKQLLSQLGKTPFIKKEKPSPFDEAVSLIWYLEHVFYDTAADMVHFAGRNIFGTAVPQHKMIAFGFWPGGDRDGNPFVTTAITLQVATRLRTAILKCYYNDIRKLKRKLTFSKVDSLVAEVEHKLYLSVFYPTDEVQITLSGFKNTLYAIRELLIGEHKSLYLEDLDLLLHKMNLYGFYFATLDVRQNSKIHTAVYAELAGSTAGGILPENYSAMTESEKLRLLPQLKAALDPADFSDVLTRETLESVYAMRTIQQSNGEEASNRYIISNAGNAVEIMETYTLFRLCGWESPTVDIIPLFEVIRDLDNAAAVMEALYLNPAYAAHLKTRAYKQTVMLGFSDGTKDGGYLMANWSIYKAKEAITAMSRKYGIKVVFFDGRGGPPARGGGKTHQFYASLGPSIENHEIQITIQGQTISSNFGTRDSCRYNLENLLSAGVSNELFDDEDHVLDPQQRTLLDELSMRGHKSYLDFRNHPKFVPYLEQMSTLRYFAKANIGSRPSKRSQSEQLDFEDLRAIPFVGSWSQLKQNVPGFFGVGSALLHFEETGRWQQVQDLYHQSLFFRTLLENSMMSIAKSFMPLTAYMKQDPEFGPFWELINDELHLSKRLLLKIAGHSVLMENYPDGRASILMREHIVLPLLTIQQYALLRIKELKASVTPDDTLIEIYEKIVTRSLFGNTNASRNSA